MAPLPDITKDNMERAALALQGDVAELEKLNADVRVSFPRLVSVFEGAFIITSNKLQAYTEDAHTAAVAALVIALSGYLTPGRR